MGKHSKPTASMLLSCPDRKGLVTAASEFIAMYDGNIIQAAQHTDQSANVFLQRMEWEMDGFRIPRSEIATAFRPIAEKFNMDWSINFSDEVPRIALFVSKIPHCLEDLLARWSMGEFTTEMPLVISNHINLQPIADKYGLPFEVFPITPESKQEQEEKILQLLVERRIDLIILARYMQIVTKTLISAFPHRMINIHHSFLPSFPGSRPYNQAHARGVKVIGATAHYVTEELDQGPIIEQEIVRVSHRDQVPDLIHKGKDLERVVLSRAVRHHLRHRVLVYGNKTVVFE